MDKLTLLEQEITALKVRNARVDSNKAWKISYSRKISIALVTYIVVVIFFFTMDFPRPFMSALVPTMGFLLSTLSISLLKKLWIRYIYKK